MAAAHPAFVSKLPGGKHWENAKNERSEPVKYQSLFIMEIVPFLRGCTLKSHWLELGPMATRSCRGVWEMNIFNQAHYTGQNWDSLLKEKG